MAEHSSRNSPRRHEQLAIAAFALIAAILFASPFTGENMFGTFDTLDNSWQWAQYVAAHNHLQFGSQYLFTYGPWGYLNLPIEGGPRAMWILTIVVTIIAKVVFLVLVISMLRRSPRLREASRYELLVLAAVVILTVLEVLAQDLYVLLGAVVLMIAADLMGSMSERVGTNVRVVLITALLAFDSLVKSSVVPYSLIVIACVIGSFLTSSEITGRRKAWLTLCCLVAYPFFFVVFWLFANQSLGGLPGFISGTVQIISGYPGSESLSGYTYQVVLLLGLAALTGVLVAIPALRRSFRRSGPDLGSSHTRMRVFWTIVMTGGVAFFWWKEGIVRQDFAFGGGHISFAIIGFAFAALVLIAVIPSGTVSIQGAIVTLTAIALSLIALSPSPIANATSPGANVTATSTGVGHVFEPAAYAQSNATAKARLRHFYRIPGSMLRAIGTRSVAIMPANLTIGPAYGLRQVILPVPQMYEVSTPQLDQLDASFLKSKRIPYVLLEYSGNGGQYTLWTPPATYNSLLTDYTIVQSIDGLVLFHWHPRVTTTRPAGTRSMVIGHWVDIPRCTVGSTIASFNLQLTPAARLTEFLFRDPAVFIDLKVGASTIGPFQFVWALASGGLNVSGYVNSPSQLEPIGQSKSANRAISAIRIIGPSGMFTTGSGGSVPVHLNCTVDG